MREREREREFFESIQSCGSLKSGQYAVEELEAVTKKTERIRQTDKTDPLKVPSVINNSHV